MKEIEYSVLALMKERAELLINRRRQDLLDSMSECSGKELAWDEERHSRVVEKEGRRRRRRETRNRSGRYSPHYDGQSSDDELLQGTEMKFQSEIGMFLMS